MYATGHVRRPRDNLRGRPHGNLRALVPSFHNIHFPDLNWSHQSWQQAPYSPSHLSGPLDLFFCSTLLWHPAFSDRVVAAGTTVMGSKGKARAVVIELCLPWSAAPAAGCFGVYESKRVCFSFYQSGLGSLTKQLPLTLQVTIPKSILCPISSSGAHKGPVSRFNLWPVSLHFP